MTWAFSAAASRGSSPRISSAATSRCSRPTRPRAGSSRCFGGDGFRSDIGGHILFSKDKEALAHELAVLGDNVRQGVRANKILYKGLHVKYPFENGIDVLPKGGDRRHPPFVRRQPAQGEADELPRVDVPRVRRRPDRTDTCSRTTTKIWKTPAEEMSLEWVDRVPRPPLLDLIKTAVGHLRPRGTRTSSTSTTRRSGGFESMPKAVAAKVGRSSRPGFRVASAPPGATAAGRSSATRARSGATGRSSRRIPIGTLFSALGDVPAAGARRRRTRLRYNSLRVALVGVRGTDLPAYTALYVPDPALALPPRLLQPASSARTWCPPATARCRARSRCRRGATSTRGRTSASSTASSTTSCATASSSASASSTARCTASATRTSSTRPGTPTAFGRSASSPTRAASTSPAASPSTST